MQRLHCTLICHWHPNELVSSALTDNQITHDYRSDLDIVNAMVKDRMAR